MNTAIIMLASNSLAEKNMEIASSKLNSAFRVKACSSVLINKPIGIKYNNDFFNQAIQIETSLTLHEAIEKCKNIEIEMGRLPESKAHGIIPIDIDIVFWNSELIRTNDFNKFDFVRVCIAELEKK